MKKVLSLFTAASLVISGFAFANEKPMLISAQADLISVNGAILEKPFVKDDQGDLMLPLKSVAEALGYQVNWNNETRTVELIKGARYITVSTKENAYTFSKMAPTELSKMALLKNGSSFVPEDFITEMLEAYGSLTDKIYAIESNLSDNINTSGYEITSIEKDRIIVKQGDGESHILFNAETLITDYATQKEIKVSDLKVGDILKITHPSIMIMIYPAQYSASHIERINGTGFTEGHILQVNEDSILVKGYNMDIQFNISKETVLKNNAGVTSLASLKPGNKVKVYHSLAMTKSLPPQSAATEIQVDSSIK